MSCRVAALYRHPVKGLSPEPLSRADLGAGAYFPGDRLYAVENGPSGFDPADPRHQPKIKFLMLMRDEALARLTTRYEDATATLSIAENGRALVSGDLSTAEGRRAVAAFLEGYLPRELRGAARVLVAPPGFRFTDSRRGFVSLINLASVRAIGDLVGGSVDPLRFRANIHIDELGPWAEFDLVGRVLEAASGVRLKVTQRIARCAATNVDPATGLRDLEIPATLMRHYGHADCGVYAEVLTGGPLVRGERIMPAECDGAESLPPA